MRISDWSSDVCSSDLGRYAQPGPKPDRETGGINEYEIWAFVDHDAYKGMKRYWGLAQRITASALRGRAEIALSVFTLDEMDRLRAVGNRFLTDKYDGGDRKSTRLNSSH